MIIKEQHLIKTEAEEQFAAWLKTQKNANGNMFNPVVANRYAQNLRIKPPKLDVSLPLNARDVFNCRTLAGFDRLNSVFLNAPNYREVNRGANRGAFSAGLAAYRRYLNFIENNIEAEILEKEACNSALVKVDDQPITDVNITYVPKQSAGGMRPMNITEMDGSTPSVPDAVIEVLNKKYASGFRFDTTYINLLASASGEEVDAHMQLALKRVMFRRNDGIYFLLDIVADAATRKAIVDFSDTYLQEYGCFEIPEFYKLYENKVNSNCIRNADDFESFYEQIGKSGVRCVQAPYIGNRIARFSNGSVWGTFKEVAAKIISVITEEHCGSCNEDDLHTKFCAFSTDLLGKIIKRCASDELIRVEINDSVCYQTFDALGLPGNFSEVLAEALERLSGIRLAPTQDALHTTLSLELGVNFKAEYNLPDWDTYRRLIAAFYKAEPRREWQSNIFGEVAN